MTTGAFSVLMIVNYTDNPQASLICVYNDEDQLYAMALSAEEQTARVELVPVSGSDGRFASAASALNFGALAASAQTLIFLHQDVEFTEYDILERLIGLASANDAVFGVAGAAGNFFTKSIVSSIEESTGEKRFKHDTLQQDIASVSTLDECLIACSRRIFNEVGFDEVTLDGWHLYAVDFCLTARMKGFESYVVRSGVWHKSSGSLDDNFREYESRLARKYAAVYPEVVTTCTWFPTGWRYRPYVAARNLKQLLVGRAS